MPGIDQAAKIQNVRALGAVLFGPENADGPMPKSLTRYLDMCRRGEYRDALTNAMTRPWRTSDPSAPDIAREYYGD